MQFASTKDLRLYMGEIIQKIQSGERYIITYRGKPVALMLPFKSEQVDEMVPRSYEEAWSEIEQTLQESEPVYNDWSGAIKESRRRMEILISEEEFRFLKEKAREKKCSLGELVRETLQEKYLADQEGTRKEALKKILTGDLALPGSVCWEDLEKDLEKRYNDVAD
jgi:antitoxin (DNA-binding transcriptional repressor) of toxin-antitoxin stability system